MRSHFPKLFFSGKEKRHILEAIREAEARTSGEIRIHIQWRTPDDILAAAANVFERLGMTRTRERNGVLILFGTQKKRFAIAADRGIYEKVPAHFWDTIAAHLEAEFKRDRFAEGLTQGILEIGEKLRTFFPASKENPNELPNRISYSL